MLKIPPVNSYNSLKTVKNAIKNLSNNPTTKDYQNIKNLAAQTVEIAQNEINEKLVNNKLAKKTDKILTNIFEKFARLFNKTAGYQTDNLGKTIINSVLIGNILKDLMTGIISTSQSFTNPDYSKEKRLFMGSYDIMACLTTISLSYILGPMSINKIDSIYKNLLKSLKKTPKYNMVTQGLTTFTALILQSIIAKRVIAPAISTPMATKMKKKLEEKQ